MISWDRVDTVLLDMDGTLLDLNYDNTLWNQLVPMRYSEARSIPLDAARDHLFAHMLDSRGQLIFYCLDHWAEFTGLDIVGLHSELTDLIRYRPYAEEFLVWLRTRGKRSLLVTNAHRDSLNVKDAHSDVTSKLDADVSCHDYGAPKENPVFWAELMARHPYEPERTLLIDDNDAVLTAAGEFGIAHLLTVAQPDSRRPPREGLGYPAFTDFREILPDE
ncbi:MAG: GMP/IMP nucleotidase [Gammaproteobacteria bacterium]|nr:MAG: GMP/IMP nucleotidase [Gammaproteobacteria bacterium]